MGPVSLDRPYFPWLKITPPLRIVAFPVGASMLGFGTQTTPQDYPGGKSGFARPKEEVRVVNVGTHWADTPTGKTPPMRIYIIGIMNDPLAATAGGSE